MPEDGRGQYSITKISQHPTIYMDASGPVRDVYTLGAEQSPIRVLISSRSEDPLTRLELRKKEPHAPFELHRLYLEPEVTIDLGGQKQYSRASLYRMDADQRSRFCQIANAVTTAFSPLSFSSENGLTMPMGEYPLVIFDDYLRVGNSPIAHAREWSTTDQGLLYFLSTDQNDDCVLALHMPRQFCVEMCSDLDVLPKGASVLIDIIMPNLPVKGIVQAINERVRQGIRVVGAIRDTIDSHVTVMADSFE